MASSSLPNRVLQAEQAGKASESKENFLRPKGSLWKSTPNVATRLGSPVNSISQFGRTCSLFLSCGNFPQNTQNLSICSSLYQNLKTQRRWHMLCVSASVSNWNCA